MLSVDDTALIVIDFQEKLVRAMYEPDKLVQNAVKLIEGAKILDIPILWAEQNPKGLGPTVSEIKDILEDMGLTPITKTSFSCCGESEFERLLDDVNRDQYLIAGIECHVCVYQTAMDLLDDGQYAEVVADAVASRTIENKNMGLQKCRDAGASVTSVETALFELLRVAEGDEFKAMLKVIK